MDGEHGWFEENLGCVQGFRSTDSSLKLRRCISSVHHINSNLRACNSTIDACKFSMRRAAADGSTFHAGVGRAQPVLGKVKVRRALLHLYGAAMKRRHTRVDRCRASLQMADSRLDTQRSPVQGECSTAAAESRSNPVPSSTSAQGNNGPGS